MKKLRLALLASLCAASPVFADAPIKWRGWDGDVFARARTEQRFVILDLEAVWCHWCHVQDEKTYSDPKVEKLIGQKYIAVRADQDAIPNSRPAMATGAGRRRSFSRRTEQNSSSGGAISSPSEWRRCSRR